MWGASAFDKIEQEFRRKYPGLRERSVLTTDGSKVLSPVRDWLGDFESREYPDIDHPDVIRQWFDRQIEKLDTVAQIAAKHPELASSFGDEVVAVRDAIRIARHVGRRYGVSVPSSLSPSGTLRELPDRDQAVARLRAILHWIEKFSCVSLDGNRREDRELILNSLKPAVRRAILAYEHAEKQIESPHILDRDAWNLLKEQGVREPDSTELVDYCPPAFATFARHLRTARKALKEQKHQPRAVRTAGKSVVSSDEI